MGLTRRAVEGIAAWVDDRTGAVGLLKAAQKKLVLKPVPRGLAWAYTLGSVALFLFSLQFLTGFLLLSQYVPDAAGAYRSVQKIQNQVQLGWLVRQVHSWGASFVVAALILHMLKVLWFGGYKRPREFTWFLGVILFFIALGFCFTGYLLPWNQLGRWATSVGTDAVVKLPLVGEPLGKLVRGGEDVSGNTLGRFFAVHVFILPLALVVFLIAHLALVQRHGISTHLRVKEESSLGYTAALEASGGAEPFFPRQAYRDLLAINLAFAALVLAAGFWPWELGPPASDDTPVGIKPEWYFLPVYQCLKYFPSELAGIAAINGAMALFFLLPLLDRGNERRLSRRPFFAAVATLSLLLVVGLGVLGNLSDRTVTLFGSTYRFSAKGYPELVVPGGSSPRARPEAVPAPAPPAVVPAPPALSPAPATLASAPAASLAAAPAEGSPPAPSGPAESPAAPAEGGQKEGAPAPPPEPPPETAPAEPPESSVALEPPAAGGPAASGAEAAAGSCAGCHKQEMKSWLRGVHARPRLPGSPEPISGCADCHGGDRIAKEKEPAHQGILSGERRRKVVARKPEGKEVVELCGRCHTGVADVFSPDHLALEPARSCFNCHSNHAIRPAGLWTFKKGYQEGDPRSDRFFAVRGAARELEDGLADERRKIDRLEESLLEREAGLGDLEEELKAAEATRREARVLTHSLDLGKVRAKGEEALAAVKQARQGLEERLGDFERRKHLAASIGTVSLIFAALLALALRRLR
jgi:ubiquinol-cytochrome c reductase cytochrome b subunit